VLSYVNNRRLT